MVQALGAEGTEYNLTNHRYPQRSYVMEESRSGFIELYYFKAPSGEMERGN